MKSICKALILPCLAIVMLSGCGQSGGQSKPSQEDFDLRMVNWQERNNDPKAGPYKFPQKKFDSMMADWLKRREEQARKERSHGHAHGPGGHE